MRGTQKGEVRFPVCADHKEHDFRKHYPEHHFNVIISFPGKECVIKGCSREAFFTAIGIEIPDTVGEIQRPENEKLCRATYEIYREAKDLLDNGPALEKLTYYLESRVVPSSFRRQLAKKLLNHYASLILEKLKINPQEPINDRNKHLILRELDLYPEQYE
jgi:hypothetical protein